jgi:hypothetical protein
MQPADLRVVSRADRAIAGRPPAPDWSLRGAPAPVFPEHARMNDHRTPTRRPLRLWLAGQATILAGAAAMAWTHSFVPMALAGSAALMLTVPLVKALLSGGRIRG